MSVIQNKQKRADDKKGVDLVQILKIILKNYLWIVIAALLLGGLFFLAAKTLITPTYQTSFRVYVNNALDTKDKTSVSNSDLSAARSLASTYSEIIKGRTVLTESAERAGLDIGYSKLSRMVSVSSGSATEIITVSVTTANPVMSKQFAEKIIEVAQEKVASIVDGSSMRVIDQPYIPQGIYAPNYKRYTALGVLLGALLMILFLYIKEILDDRVHDEEPLRERFGYAILGSIPNYTAASKSGKDYSTYGNAKAEKGAR